MRSRNLLLLVGGAVLPLSLAAGAPAAEQERNISPPSAHSQAPSELPVHPALLPKGKQPGTKAGGVGFVASQGPHDMLFSNLKGAKVTNRAGEVVGQVDDITIDRNGATSAVVIGIGGVWGLGAREIGAPFRSVRFGHDSSGNRVAMVDADSKALTSAPDFQKSEKPTAAPAMR